MAVKRFKTKYPGVFYRLVQSRVRKGKEEKVFYIYFKKDGKPVEERVGKEWENKMTPAAASRILGDRLEGKRKSPKEIREEAASKKEAWTIGKLWEEYSAHRPPNTKSHNTDKNRHELYLKEKFSKAEPANLVQLEVERLRVNLLKSHKPQTVKHVLALLKRIINFGENKGLCQGPRFKITLPRVNNTTTEDLSPDQLSNLLRAIEEDPHKQAGDIMKFILFTGMRRGELFKLQWQDIDFDRGFIFIRDPKGGQSQKIPLNDGARHILAELPRSSDFVFPGKGGGQRVDINHQVRRIAEKAGLPMGFRPLHGLRHYFASSLASSGQVDMYTLQKLLTHKSPQMTQRYAHLRDEVLKAGSSVAESLINKAIAQQEDNNKKVVQINKK
ncbi:MAG: tyrosine-type recombinase/integrase [Desulfobulbaceae bacterium]